MKKNLISLSIAAFLGSLAIQASASALTALDSSAACAERPRGADNERPGDRQRRGGRSV